MDSLHWVRSEGHRGIPSWNLSLVSLYPSCSFLPKNQLAKNGPESGCGGYSSLGLQSRHISQEGQITLLVLSYYLNKTKDLRDISPSTISSWIKQTMILCCHLSDQESLTLHQVKAHDVTIIVAFKAFQCGISSEQILSACH